MNCQAIQNQILGLPDPRELSPVLREHVMGCAVCQVWARQAARLETILEQLPVPEAPGDKKEAMLGDLMQAEPVILPMATPAQRPGLGLVAVRFLRRNATYASGLAAAILVAVGIYALWPKTNPVQGDVAKSEKDPLAAKIVTRNAALARADSPVKRLEELNGMADDIAVHARGMARITTGAELKEMVGWYEKTVQDGMVPTARELSDYKPAEREKVLDGLAAKLNADAVAAETLAREAPQDAQPALQRMAETAREGEKALRAAAREGK